MRKPATDLRDAGSLRADLTVDESADTIWATNSSELYIMFTNERGWSPDWFEHWLADTWSRLLLPHGR